MSNLLSVHKTQVKLKRCLQVQELKEELKGTQDVLGLEFEEHLKVFGTLRLTVWLALHRQSSHLAHLKCRQ